MKTEEALKLFKDKDYWGEVSYRGGHFNTINDAREAAVKALEKLEQFEKENAKMKSILNKFCAEFLCRECPFLDKENEQCTISELLL